MKFKFCSDGDCPSWVLAALHALSSLPAQHFKALLQHVVEEQPDDGIMEILNGTSLSSREECARAAAVIRWVLAQAWRGAWSSVQLTRDLLVVGVPPSHATALAVVANSGRDAHLTHAQSNSFMVNKVVDVTLNPGPEDTVDMYKLTLFTENVSGEHNRKEILIEKSQANALLTEFKEAYKKIQSMDKESC